MDLHCLAVARSALEGVRRYSVGDACIVLWIGDTSKASGHGVELKHLMLAFSRIHDTEYVRKVHTGSHPFLLMLCLPACLTEKEGRFPSS